MAATAPPVTFQDRWSWWIEGGAIHMDGDPGVAGLNNPPFDVLPADFGGEGALGFDYRFGTSGWLMGVQLRFGWIGDGSASNNPVASFIGTGAAPVVVAGTNSAERHELHWVADFMVGRDLGLGQGQTVAKFGVRVAEIRGTTKGTAQWNNVAVTTGVSCSTAPSYCGSEVRYYTQRSQFIGAGPRLEIDGTIPLGNAWSFQYMAGVAGLYGRRKLTQDVTITHPTVPTFTSPAVLQTGGPIYGRSSSHDFILNVDAMLGLAVPINPNATFLISYRFDGYWNALRGYDENGNLTSLDRFFHGPMIRFTVTN